MIVRSRDYGKIQRVGELQNLRPLLLDHSNPLGRRVAELDRIKTRESLRLVHRQLGEVSGNGENQKWRRSRNSQRGVAHRIVPIAFWIERERRIDSDHDDVFVLIARFKSWQEYRSISDMRRIPSHSSSGTGETLVIAHVRGVEPRRRVPRTIALGCEPLSSIP